MRVRGSYPPLHSRPLRGGGFETRSYTFAPFALFAVQIIPGPTELRAPGITPAVAPSRPESVGRAPPHERLDLRDLPRRARDPLEPSIGDDVVVLDADADV